MPLVNHIIASPLIPDKLRIKLYRLAGMKASTGVFIHSNVFITRPVSNIYIGNRSFINHNCFLENHEDIVIGIDVCIAHGVTIFTTTHNIGAANRRVKNLVCKPVIIQDGCWIGCNSTIFPGVKIGSGCVIGAGSIVRSDCEPNGVYVGVPARRIKDLN